MTAHTTIGVNVLTELARGVGWLMVRVRSVLQALEGRIRSATIDRCVHRDGNLPPISILHVCRLAINTMIDLLELGWNSARF